MEARGSITPKAYHVTNIAWSRSVASICLVRPMSSTRNMSTRQHVPPFSKTVSMAQVSLFCSLVIFSFIGCCEYVTAVGGIFVLIVDNHVPSIVFTLMTYVNMHACTHAHAYTLSHTHACMHANIPFLPTSGWTRLKVIKQFIWCFHRNTTTNELSFDMRFDLIEVRFFVCRYFTQVTHWTSEAAVDVDVLTFMCQVVSTTYAMMPSGSRWKATTTAKVTWPAWWSSSSPTLAAHLRCVPVSTAQHHNSASTSGENISAG